MKMPRKSKKEGQREEDLKDFPQEIIPHDIPEQELNEAFGEGKWTECLLLHEAFADRADTGCSCRWKYR